MIWYYLIFVPFKSFLICSTAQTAASSSNSIIESLLSNGVKNRDAKCIGLQLFPWFCCRTAPNPDLLALQTILIGQLFSYADSSSSMPHFLNLIYESIYVLEWFIVLFFPFPGLTFFSNGCKLLPNWAKMGMKRFSWFIASNCDLSFSKFYCVSLSVIACACTFELNGLIPGWDNLHPNHLFSSAAILDFSLFLSDICIIYTL